jgi:hypothetical protein
LLEISDETIFDFVLMFVILRVWHEWHDCTYSVIIFPILGK